MMDPPDAREAQSVVTILNTPSVPNYKTFQKSWSMPCAAIRAVEWSPKRRHQQTSDPTPHRCRGGSNVCVCARGGRGWGGWSPHIAQNAMEPPTARPKILKAIDEGMGEQGRRRVTSPLPSVPGFAPAPLYSYVSSE